MNECSDKSRTPTMWASGTGSHDACVVGVGLHPTIRLLFASALSLYGRYDTVGFERSGERQ